MNGDHARAAELLASLSETEPSKGDLAKSAFSEALGAGQTDLALSIAGRVPAASLPTEGRLLLAAADIRRGRPERALPWLASSGASGDLTFLAPLINAWAAADRGDAPGALSALDQVAANNPIGSLVPEERAFILLKFRRTAEAEPYARQAIGHAGGRDERVRLALADGFVAAGDRARALMMVEAMGAGETQARQRIMSGRQSGQAIDNLPKAFAEALTAIAADLMRVQHASPPIGLVQVARYLNPQNSSTIAVLALMLAQQDRAEEGLALLRAVPSNDALISEVRDVQVRILTNAKRLDDAYRVAAAAVTAPGADGADYSRLGDVLQAMNRHSEAADAYGRAIALAEAQNLRSALWGLQLLRAAALQDAKRWTEAQAALKQGLALAPDEPLLLNFLGYAELERGENVDAAEAMIRKASELAPDDASITDSLGWAEFKRGKVSEAIETLQRAAEKDANQADIQEHLGDALYSSGRRYEARFAWRAALVTAENDVAGRVKAKLVSGLTPANRAP